MLRLRLATEDLGLEALPPKREQSIHLSRQSKISQMRNSGEAERD
jgi:hypothetical protein